MEAVMAEMPARQITLRLPEPLYHRVKQIAQKRRISINRLAQESLEALAEQALAEELRAAYDALGADEEENDVEFFLPAQLEVLESE
jgi:predicted transcriptional regulator